VKKIDLIIIFFFLVILLTGVFLIVYYFKNQSDECLRNPLVYGSKQMEKETGYRFTGIGILHTPTGFKAPTITFNSTHLTVE
jgi:hypothetical protein